MTEPKAKIRCFCPRCGYGSVYWTDVVAYNEDHQLGPGEYLLSHEAQLVIDYGPMASLFADDMEVSDL